MKPASPVIPNKNYDEIIVAEHQDEYQNLPSIPLQDDVILCRWHMNEEERKIVAETGDIYLLQWTGGRGVTPMLLQVEPPELTQPAAAPAPQMMTAVRRSSQAVNNANRHGFEIFEDDCSNCSHVVIYTSATKETLEANPETKVICMVCFKNFQVENPELEGVFLPNTQKEMEKVHELIEEESPK